MVIPLFALANAGIVLNGDVVPGGRPLLGVVVGLVVGKAVGVAGATWLTVRGRPGRLPAGVRWSQGLVGVACLAGIGFTVSLFVSGLAFHSPTVAAEAKAGVLIASVLAAVVGAVVLAAASRAARAHFVR